MEGVRGRGKGRRRERDCGEDPCEDGACEGVESEGTGGGDGRGLEEMAGGSGSLWVREWRGGRVAGEMGPMSLQGRCETMPPLSALGLGVTRGAAPCVKLLVLAPLLIAVGPLAAVPIALAFAIASSGYPLIGFLAASSLSHLPRSERPMRLIGAAILVFSGIYVVVRETLHYLAPGVG